MKELIEHLQQGTALVTFKKVNGDIRKLECTLVEYLLPKVQNANPTKTSAQRDVTVVYDLEADAWRSFRNDSVIEVELL